MEVEVWLLVALVGVMLGAAFCNGVAGLGFALLAVASMAVLLDPRTAIVLMSLVTPALTSLQMRYHWTHRNVVRRLAWIMPGAVVGAVFGSQLLVVLPTYVLSIALGLFALWFGLSSLRKQPLRISPGLERRIAPGVGLLTGVTQGALGASGPVLGSYILAIGLRGRDFIFAVSSVFALMSFVRVATLAALGQYTVTIVVVGLGLLLPAVLGQRLGFALQSRLSASTFHRVIIGVLVLASANLLYGGISEAMAVL